MRLAREIICTILILNLSFPATVFAATRGDRQSAVILPIVEGGAGVGAQFANELSNALARDLGATVNTIDLKIINQANKGIDTKSLAVGYQSFFKRLSNAKNRYSLDGDSKAAIQELEQLSQDLLVRADFNMEVAKIFESAQLSKAWIQFQIGKKQSSADTIAKIAAVKATHKINTDGYPGAFGKFITKTVQERHFDDSTLEIDAKPRSVDVFINGIYAGDSSTPIQVPAGKSIVHLSSPGRRTVAKTVNLATGETKVLKSALAWSRKGGQSVGEDLPQDPFEQLSLSTAVNQGIHADKVVFLSVRDVNGGYQVAARVYDQNYHQPLATIQYPKTIRDIRKSSASVHRFLDEKLTPYLSKPANKLWKGDFDQKIILDDRIASRPREPIYRKPAFWAVVGGVVVSGVVLGLALSSGGSSSAGGDGSVVVDISGFRGVAR